MPAPTYYTWNEESKKFEHEMTAQIDPLETEKAGHEVYCGLPQNATMTPPLEEKEGFDVVMGDNGWEYKEQPKPEPAPEPTELDLARQAYYDALNALSATDYRALKYVDGEYTAEEYEQYRTERAQLRQAVRDAEARVKELEDEEKAE